MRKEETINTTALREQLEGLRHVTVGQLKDQYRRRSTSRIFRMDNLLAGTVFLPWEVHCAGIMPSAARLWKSFRTIVNAIPGSR